MVKLFSKRNVLGAALFLVLVGEVTVGSKNDLFTPVGLMILVSLYFWYFLLLDAIMTRYNLDNLGLVLVNFALYSVLITGLLHGELDDYVTHPENWLITTLIRIQCSFYPLFAFYLLRRLAPKTRKSLPLPMAVALFFGFIALITPSESFGFIQLARTFDTAPFITVGFSAAAIAALVMAWRRRPAKTPYSGNMFGIWSAVILLVGLIPGLGFFLLLLILSIIVGMIFIAKPRFRTMSVN